MPSTSIPADGLLVALPSPVYRAILGFVPPAVTRLMAERRVLLRAGGADPDTVEALEPADAFEHWLIERWLKDIRSDEFRHSVQHERLMAEWERGL